MPPEQPYTPPPAPSSALDRTKVLAGLGIIVVLLIIAGALYFFFGNTRSTAQFVVADGEAGVAYIYTQGRLSAATEVPTPQDAVYAPEGWLPVTVTSEESGLRACSSKECAEIFSYGIPPEMPVAFTVEGDTLALISPLTKEFMVYTLYPSTPVRIEPAYVATNAAVPGVGAIAKEQGTDNYVFAESVTRESGSVLRVCRATVPTGTAEVKAHACAETAVAAPLTSLFITQLP